MAENALQLLNCVPVNGKSVLFLDGNVQCLQVWQYGMILVVSTFIIPFFVVLLFGPRVLQRGRISVTLLMVAFVFPLLFAGPLVYMFVKEYRKNKADLEASREREKIRRQREITRRIRMDLDAEDELAELDNEMENEVRSDDVGEVVCSVVFGPYLTVEEATTDNLGKPAEYMYGLCWEGVINLRRLIQVLIVTFINDILTKHIALTFVCFLFLLIHLRARPFKYALSNTAEAISLSLLLNLAIANLVKAGFYNSQTVPRDSGFLVVVALEWVETITLILLPAGICLTLALSILLRSGKCALNFKRCKTRKREPRNTPLLLSPNNGAPKLIMVRHIGMKSIIDNMSGKLSSINRTPTSRSIPLTTPWNNDEIREDIESRLSSRTNILRRNVIVPNMKKERNTRISHINQKY